MAKMYIQSSSGLQPLGGGDGEVTKESISKALGFEPADSKKIENIEDNGSKALLITDPQGNVIARINENGIQSVEFRAKDLNIGETLATILETLPDIKSEEEDKELKICDTEGNVIFKVNEEGVHTTNIRVANGDVVTSKLTSKKVSILGDSISTFNGYLPDGYATYYPKGDVTSVYQTWWKQLIDNNNMILGTNASYTGSTVQSDGSGIAACDDSRIAAVGANGNPDLIIVYMGVNDSKIENLVDIGEINPLIDMPFTSDTPNNYDTTTFIGAYQAMLVKLMLAYPEARIACCGLLWNNQPQYMTSDDLAVASNKIHELCDLYGAEFIDLRKCGINPANMGTYLGTSDSCMLHPKAAGMTKIADYIGKCLK